MGNPRLVLLKIIVITIKRPRPCFNELLLCNKPPTLCWHKTTIYDCLSHLWIEWAQAALAWGGSGNCSQVLAGAGALWRLSWAGHPRRHKQGAGSWCWLSWGRSAVDPSVSTWTFHVTWTVKFEVQLFNCSINCFIVQLFNEYFYYKYIPNSARDRLLTLKNKFIVYLKFKLGAYFP